MVRENWGVSLKSGKAKDKTVWRMAVSVKNSEGVKLLIEEVAKAVWVPPRNSLNITSGRLTLRR